MDLDVVLYGFKERVGVVEIKMKTGRIDIAISKLGPQSGFLWLAVSLWRVLAVLASPTPQTGSV